METSRELLPRHHPGRQVLVEAALVIFRHRLPLRLVALVQERRAEGEADVAENARIFRPGNHRAAPC